MPAALSAPTRLTSPTQTIHGDKKTWGIGFCGTGRAHNTVVGWEGGGRVPQGSLIEARLRERERDGSSTSEASITWLTRVKQHDRGWIAVMWAWRRQAARARELNDLRVPRRAATENRVPALDSLSV